VFYIYYIKLLKIKRFLPQAISNHGSVIFGVQLFYKCRSHWLRDLRRRSTAAHLLRLWVRIPPGAWISVYCECCVLSGRGLCDELITCLEESNRLWCVIVCNLETSRMRRPWPTGGCRAKNKQTNMSILCVVCVFLTYWTRMNMSR